MIISFKVLRNKLVDCTQIGVIFFRKKEDGLPETGKGLRRRGLEWSAYLFAIELFHHYNGQLKSGSVFLLEYSITWFNGAAGDNLSEQSLPGHNAVAGLSFHGTPLVMTFLADLGDFQNNCFTKGQLVSDLESGKIDIPGDDILGKGTVVQAGQLFFHQIDAFTGQQGNLPMPFTGMGIIGDAPVLFE
jgi:hypothetical protein